MKPTAEDLRVADDLVCEWLSGQWKDPLTRTVETKRAIASAIASEREKFQEIEQAAKRALARFDREDKGGLSVRDGLAWAMAEDLRAALAAVADKEK